MHLDSDILKVLQKLDEPIKDTGNFTQSTFSFKKASVFYARWITTSGFMSLCYLYCLIDMAHIFIGDLADNSTWKFDFSEISKRRFGRKYWEITSYDPDGRNIDFFNPVNYSGNVMVLFEDYGPGIVERILLEHRVNLKMKTFFVFEVTK